MAFYLKEHSNSFEYYDREILIKALSQLEYGAEESLDRRNNNAIYFNTDAQYDVFTLDEAIDKLIDIVGDDNVECLLSFHKYFLMGILLIWQEEGDVASEFIQKVVTAHCENIRTDMLLSRLQGSKTDITSENNENRLVNLQTFSTDNVYNIPDFNVDVPEIIIKNVSNDDLKFLDDILEDISEGKFFRSRVNFSSAIVDSILGYLDYKVDSTYKEDLEVYDFLEKISKSETSTSNDILREKRFYSKDFAENEVTTISLSQCPLPTYLMRDKSESTTKMVGNTEEKFPYTNLDLSIGRYSSISDIVKDVKNAKKYNPNDNGINDLLFNDSCEIQNAFKTVFMNFLYERFVVRDQNVSKPGQKFLEDVFKDLLFIKDDKTRYADYKNLTEDVELLDDDINLSKNSYFKKLKDDNIYILRNQSRAITEYQRVSSESSEMSKLKRNLIFFYESKKESYEDSNKPTFFSAFIYDANDITNKYDSVERVFFGDKQYLSSFKDTVTNTVSSGIACPYYLAPYGISLFDHTKLYLPLFTKISGLINEFYSQYSHLSQDIILKHKRMLTYSLCRRLISNNDYEGPLSSTLLYNNNSLSEQTNGNIFCTIDQNKEIIDNQYAKLCLKIFDIITNRRNDIFFSSARERLIDDLKKYITVGRKVYLELQEIVKFLNNFPQIDDDIIRRVFRKYFNTLYKNIKNKNSKYSTLSGDIQNLEKLISQANIDAEISYIAKGIKIGPSQISSFIQIIYVLNEIYLIMDDMSKNLQDIIDFCNSPGVKILRGKVW